MTCKHLVRKVDIKLKQQELKLQADFRNAWSLVILIVSGLQLLGPSLVLLANPVLILSQKAATLMLLQRIFGTYYSAHGSSCISQVFIVFHSILSSLRNTNAAIALRIKS